MGSCVQGGIRVFACFVREGNGELTSSEEHMAIYERWQGRRVSGIQKPERIFGDESDAAKVVGHGNFEGRRDLLEIRDMRVKSTWAFLDNCRHFSAEAGLPLVSVSVGRECAD